MVRNSECLQLIEENIVDCRSLGIFGYKRETFECPLNQCDAQVVLEDETLFKRATGNCSDFGPKDPRARRIVFHYICPGLFRLPNMSFEEAIEYAEKLFNNRKFFY